MPPEARFVDVTYRGLKVALRAKLTESSPTSGFVEVDAPLPVGTRIQLADGGKVTDARVVGVVEQESGAKSPPGMRLSWGDAVAAAEPRSTPEGARAPEAAPAAAPAPAPAMEVVEPEPEPEAEAAEAAEAAGEPADTAPAMAASGNGDAPVEGRRRGRKTRKTQIGRP
jgi:hypothetical protein